MMHENFEDVAMVMFRRLQLLFSLFCLLFLFVQLFNVGVITVDMIVPLFSGGLLLVGVVLLCGYWWISRQMEKMSTNLDAHLDGMDAYLVERGIKRHVNAIKWPPNR